MSDVLTDYYDCIASKLPPPTTDGQGYFVRKTLILKALSIVATPRFALFGRLPQSFRPYWLEGPLFSLDSVTYLRGLGNEQENAQLNRLLDLDRQIAEEMVKSGIPVRQTDRDE